MNKYLEYLLELEKRDYLNWDKILKDNIDKDKPYQTTISILKKINHDINHNLNEDNIEEYQKSLFDEIKKLNTNSLSGFVQNNFKDMLEQDMINKDDLQESISDVEKSYNHIIQKLIEYKDKTINIINYYKNK